MRRLRATLWYAPLLLAFCSVAWCRDESSHTRPWSAIADIQFTNLTAPEAGANNAIAQDAAGFLWFGTQGGLTRWDGYRFHRYTADTKSPGALPDSLILSLYTDALGQLWIGTSSGGLVRYESSKDSFVTVADATALRDGGVYAITGDGESGLWIGTGAGIRHLSRHGTLTSRGAEPAIALQTEIVRALWVDRTQRLWAGTGHGLWLRRHGESQFSAVPLPLPENVRPEITCLYEDSGGRLWVGTRSTGAFIIQGTDVRPVSESGSTSSLQSDGITGFVEVEPRMVWVGTNGGGIVEVDTVTHHTRRSIHYADTITSLNDNEVAALFRDRSGLIWVATSTATSYHDPRQQAIVSLLGGTGRQNGISHSNVYFVLPRPDGRVWLSVTGGGIDIVDPESGRIKQLLPDAAHPRSALPKGRVQSMAAGSNGEVYLATQQGLYRSDAYGVRLERLSVPGRSDTASNRALFFDSGTLWLGGTADGLWELDVRSAPAIRVLGHHAQAEFGDARITMIEPGEESWLWIGTRSGLLRLHKGNGVLERLPIDPADDSQLPGGFISSLLTDRHGRLWVSSFGAGIQISEKPAREGRWKFKRLGIRHGLPHAGVDKLLADSSGNVWASTDLGLAIIDADSFSIRTLHSPDGVSIRSFWTNSGAVGADGELLFGGVGGLTVVRPARMKPWTFQPPVVLTDLRVGTSSLPIGPYNSAEPSAVPLTLSPQDRSLRIEFAALDFSAPEFNRYSYRLEGFDNAWVPADTSTRHATYTNLSPGLYTLKLRAANRSGVWSQPKQLRVRVLPAWYQTIGFRLLCLLLGIFVVFALIHARTMLLRQRQRELQALVAQRTCELEKSSHALRESQRQLQRIAYIDSLTDLPNRRQFDEELRRHVAHATQAGEPFALLLIDLDGFKGINDTLGHDAGDAMLVSAGSRITAAVRSRDCVARLGGDEFGVLLASTAELMAVEAICQRIVNSVAEPVKFKANTMRVTASIGAAFCPSRGSTAESVYKAADMALYDAKHSGRNVWRWYGRNQARASAPVE